MLTTDPFHEAESNSAEQIELILAELRGRDRFLVVSHARPDGDAVGSALTMACILEQMGKTVDVVLSDAVPWVYRTLPGVEHIQRKRRIHAADYDAAIILECDGTARTGIEGMDCLFLINIDHHRTGCAYGAINWIDPQASAVATMVYELALAAGVQVNASMATCLYTALMTDTGSFTYPGTSAETFTLAHTLIALGAKADTVARDVLYSVPAARIHLLGVALSRIRIEGPLAWTYILQRDLDELSATDEDSEGTVNYLISIVNVEAAAFLREMPREMTGETQRFRTSLRSKSSVDVSHAATLCGGGGHRNAAGCTVDGPLDAAVALILELLKHEVEQTESPAMPLQDDALPVSPSLQV